MLAVIKSFTSKDTAALYAGVRARRIPRPLWAVARRKLTQLDTARDLDELRAPPGNRLEKLKKSRKGQWSIRINGQWRVCFRFEHGDAYDVEIVDYHGER